MHQHRPVRRTLGEAHLLNHQTAGSEDRCRPVEHTVAELRPLDHPPFPVSSLAMCSIACARPRIPSFAHQLSFTSPPFTFSMPPPSTVPLALALSSMVVP